MAIRLPGPGPNDVCEFRNTAGAKLGQGSGVGLFGALAPGSELRGAGSLMPLESNRDRLLALRVPEHLVEALEGHESITIVYPGSQSTVEAHVDGLRRLAAPDRARFDVEAQFALGRWDASPRP